MTDIKWEEPPAKSRTAKYAEIAEALRQRPGAWAVVSDDMATSNVSHIRSGRLVAFTPPGDFDARAVARTGTRRGRVYARYVGGDQ